MAISSTNQGSDQVYGAQGKPIQGNWGPPIIASRDPASTDINYKVGREWINKVTPSIWFLGSKAAGTAVWIAAGSGTVGGVVTLTGDTGGALSPTAGNINILGTSVAGLSFAGSGSTLTGNILASSTTQRGTVALSTNAVSVTGTDATVAVTPASLTARLAAPGAIGGTTPGSGAFTTITSTGNITSGNDFITVNGDFLTTSGDIATTFGTIFSGSTLTAASTITGQNGPVTASNGNFVGSTAGTGFQFNANTATGIASGPVVLNSRAGQVIFTSVSIAAAADLTLTITNSRITGSSTQVIYSMSGATTGSALSIKSVTNTAGSSAIVVTNGTGATTSTSDITLNFLVVN